MHSYIFIVAEIPTHSLLELFFAIAGSSLLSVVPEPVCVAEHHFKADFLSHDPHLTQQESSEWFC